MNETNKGLLDESPNSIRGKLIFLVFEKVLLGALLGTVALIYNHYRDQDRKDREAENQLLDRRHKRAELIHSLLPEVVNPATLVQIRIGALRLLTDDEILDRRTALHYGISISRQMTEDYQKAYLAVGKDIEKGMFAQGSWNQEYLLQIDLLRECAIPLLSTNPEILLFEIERIAKDMDSYLGRSWDGDNLPSIKPDSNAGWTARFQSLDFWRETLARAIQKDPRTLEEIGKFDFISEPDLLGALSLLTDPKMKEGVRHPDGSPSWYGIASILRDYSSTMGWQYGSRDRRRENEKKRSPGLISLIEEFRAHAPQDKKFQLTNTIARAFRVRAAYNLELGHTLWNTGVEDEKEDSPSETSKTVSPTLAYVTDCFMTSEEFRTVIAIEVAPVAARTCKHIENQEDAKIPAELRRYIRCCRKLALFEKDAHYLVESEPMRKNMTTIIQYLIKQAGESQVPEKRQDIAYLRSTLKYFEHNNLQNDSKGK